MAILVPALLAGTRPDYREVEIKAHDVEHAHVGKASLEATMHAIDLGESTWLIDRTPGCRSANWKAASSSTPATSAV